MRFADQTIPAAKDFISVDDPRDLGQTSRLSQRLPSDISMVRYRLHDRALLRSRFDAPISIHSRVQTGDLSLTRITERFQTEMEIAGAGLSRYWFGMVNAGSLLVEQRGRSAVATGASGLALRGHAGTKTLSSDGNVRTNLWIEADALERALSALIDRELRRQLEFKMVVDWNSGLAGSLAGQIDYLVAELRRPGGMASNRVALASFNDLLLRTILLGFAHSYSEDLPGRASLVAPGYVRRADEFMRTYADRPLRMEQVAAAAGCSVRTLEAGYQRFRDTTPLAALRAIRMEQIHLALRRGWEEPLAELARRYGFTNAGRLAKAYLGRYGELPSETSRQRTSRCGVVLKIGEAIIPP